MYNLAAQAVVRYSITNPDAMILALTVLLRKYILETSFEGIEHVVLVILLWDYTWCA